ncbi:hypothetical protein L596_025810 [Steinernema carpocapsae]|uniref:Uncharacterized protein n=1 Tax=Steinernema carpocapsae TaxID=34508 RepID=A0A4U5MA33_STECR|nr:hypothetical protein L596_025810 [Steinernema carpocapsae]
MCREPPTSRMSCFIPFLLWILFISQVSGSPMHCAEFQGYEVAASVARKFFRFPFQGPPIDLYKKVSEKVKIPEFLLPYRSHLLLGYDNELFEIQFQVGNNAKWQMRSVPDRILLETVWKHKKDSKKFPIGYINASAFTDSITFFNGVIYFRSADSNTKENPDKRVEHNPGNIFDITGKRSHVTTNASKGQLIGVLHGKEIYRKKCSGKDRKALHKTKNFELDSSEFYCFVIENCELAYGPKTMFHHVAVVPRIPIS